jgi:hypothetical protein
MSDAPYQPMDRRPITARSWPVWQSVVSWLVRRGVSANTISIVGMAAGIAAGAALAATSFSEAIVLQASDENAEGADRVEAAASA